MTRLTSIAFVIAGCTTTESDDILTSGIYASIEAQTQGNGKTDVRTTLFVGNPIGLNYVELTGDDALIATSSGMSKPMRETQLLNTVGHHAEFSTDAEGTQFEVAFERTIDGGAPSSIATLPAKFEIANAPQTASRGQAITLTWSPAGSPDNMSWTATGDCIGLESAPIGTDNGTVTIAGATLVKRMDTNVADNCDITIKLARTRAGVLDPHYGKGGVITGTQYRTVTITSTP